MKVLFRFFLLCGMIQCIASSCTGSEADRVHYCKTFQKDYSEGIKTLIFEEQDVGVINSTVFSSPNLRSVMTLTLRGSRIHTIESGAFRHFSGLITLELQNNKLTTISSSWFGNPTILEHLNVAGNVIDQLRPDMLDGFSGLKVLNLSRNEIQKIGSERFAALSSLSSLDLSHNKLASLHHAVMAPLNSTYRLQGNPWDCSCAQRDLIMFLQGLVNASRLNESTLVTCHSPPDLDGAIVWNVSKVNCSASVILPSSGAGVHHVIFPVLFVVLAILLFILLIFLIWKKKQDKKQVRPDKGTTTGAAKAVEKGDLRITSKLFGHKDFGSTADKNPGTMERAKSAAAILVHGHFQQANPRKNIQLELSKVLTNPNYIRTKNVGASDAISKRNVELLYYNSFPRDNAMKSSMTKAVQENEPITDICRYVHNAHSSSEHDYIHIPGKALRSVEITDQSPSSHPEEPLVYLCVSTVPKESTSPAKINVSDLAVRPRLLRRTFSWPNERVHCKEDTETAYRNFLKTLNISPRPGGSHSPNHECMKEQLQKHDYGHTKISPLNQTSGKVLVKEVNMGIKKKSATGSVSRNRTEPKSRGGQTSQTSTPKSINQRSGYGKRPRKRDVTPESGVRREDLDSQESETRSDLRSTPDDDALLENNEYHFIDLLHEVVENHGRWTRERWRQVHQRNSSRTSPQS